MVDRNEACPGCGVQYGDLRTGLRYRDIYAEFWISDADNTKWHPKRRRTILGRWYEHKQTLWAYHVNECARKGEGAPAHWDDGLRAQALATTIVGSVGPPTRLPVERAARDGRLRVIPQGPIDLRGKRRDAFLRWSEAWSACGRCELSKCRTNVVAWSGRPGAALCVVGEAPGADEDRVGEAFVGAAGGKLDEVLTEAGTSREHTFIVNVLGCFPEGTQVEARDVERSYRRFYSGELVRVTAGHNQLTGTPNHPVLTQRGWVPLGELVEGDNLFRGRLGKPVGGGDPDVDHRPTGIEEVHRALAMSAVRQRVVGTDVDFHGDGRQADVEVVSVNGCELRNAFDPALAEHVEQVRFATPDRVPGLLEEPGAGLHQTHGGFRRPGDPARRFVSSIHQSGALLGGGEAPAFGHALAAVSERNVGGDGLSQSALPDSEALGNRLDAFASLVTPERVVKIERFASGGHVHNLQTSSGWYIANGFIVSNCRPPGNRTPKAEEIAACRRRLEMMLWLARPKALVLAGGVPAAALAGVRPISRWVGEVVTVEIPGPQGTAPLLLPAVPTYHPAFLLRGNSSVAEVAKHVRTALDAANVPF